MSNEIMATRETFDREVLASDLPVLVDFSAPRCEQCRAIEPLIEELEGEFAGRVKFVLVDVDKEPLLAARHMIGAVPTLLLFKGGVDIDEDLDFTTPGVLRSELERTAPKAEPLCGGTR